MIGPFHRLRIACNDTTASQLAEFAIVLPLLMVLMIGIYDFSNALSVKHAVALPPLRARFIVARHNEVTR